MTPLQTIRHAARSIGVAPRRIRRATKGTMTAGQDRWISGPDEVDYYADLTVAEAHGLSDALKAAGYGRSDVVPGYHPDDAAERTCTIYLRGS